MNSRNYSFEALAEVTSTDWDVGRGELNAALKSIRDQCEIEDDYLLADEIHTRGRLYREVMGDAILTPSALAKHWARVSEEFNSRRASVVATNLGVSPTDCSTCHGDRFVLVALRKPQQSTWMREHGIEASESEMLEEYAACPDCNSVDTSFRRAGDGSYAKAIDPARVREMMHG